MMKKIQINFNKKYELLFKYDPEVFFYFLYSGRAAGKSFAISTYLAIRLIQQKGNLVFCRQYMTNTATSVIPEFLNKIELLGIRKYLKVNKDHIICTLNDNILWFKGLQTAEGTAEASLKGIPNLACVVIDEMQEVKQPAFDRLIGTVRDKSLKLSVVCALNPTNQSTWIYKRFFSNIPQKFSGRLDNKVYIYSSYIENKKYLSDTYLKQIENIKEVDRLKYENEFQGIWLKQNYNALWTKEMIDRAHKLKEFPESFEQVAIGVDPAGSHNKTSDETGIIVAGLADQIIYVIQERTGRYTPKEWSNIVGELYNKYNANVVVAQSNFGGDLVQQNIRFQYGDNIYIEMVRASKSKIVRAEPIAGLYQADKVKHLKYFSQLEKEQLTFSGDPKEKSPNSLDASVYAINWLYEQLNMDSSGYV